MEQVRSIHVKVVVDTNKQTYTLDKEVEDTLDAILVVGDFLDDINRSC